jgi:glycosyltransferase involved in cell wall biosynthesis
MIYHTFQRLRYVIRFWWLIWSLRSRYDKVFVHMNPEYLILGGLDWWVMGKRVSFWYNHPEYNLRLALASLFASKIFYTSPYAATAKMKKSVRMPAGIDTEIFKPASVPRNRHALYMQGRIMPSKHVAGALVALRALRSVAHFAPDTTLTLVGPEDKAYADTLRKDFSDIMGAVNFAGPKRNTETPELYSAHAVSINLAADGHYDKSVLESMACGTPAVFSSKAFVGLIGGQMYVPTPESLVLGLLHVLQLSDAEYKALSDHARAVVVEKESLTLLAEKLVQELV